MPLRIAFTGDIALPSSALRFPKSSSYHHVIANLEGPLLQAHSTQVKSVKAGPHIYNSPKLCSDPSIKISNWIFSGSNNHIMDFGEEGLRSTLAFLAAHDSHLLGAGFNLEESRKGLVLTSGSDSVNVVSCSEKTFRTSSFGSPGIAEVGDWVHRQLASNRDSGVPTIVLHHGGTEDFSLPSPETVELYRSWIDGGAKLVIGTHPHVVQPFEKYKTGHIFYGLGNFAVEPKKWTNSDQKNLTSILVEVEVKNGDLDVNARLVSCASENTQGLVEIQAIDDSRVFSHLEEIGNLINNRALHEAVWYECVDESYRQFFRKQLVVALVLELLFLAIPRRVSQRLKFLNQPLLFDLIAWRSNRLVIEHSLARAHGHTQFLGVEEAKALWERIKEFSFR